MRSIFEVVPDNLFSVLASPNKHIYFRALMVLRDCYQRELHFSRSDLVTYFVSQMEVDLYDMAPERDEVDDPVDVEAEADLEAKAKAETEVEPVTLSGRAHALVRKLVETGWIAAITDNAGLDETLIVPDYASSLLETLHSIVEPADKRYNAYVYAIYSSLRTANEERDDFMFQALQAAYDNTLALRENLRALLHNIHLFYQKLQDRKEIRELLAEHFDEYQLGVAVKTYHPLKTVDSVYRFRPRILHVLRGWLQQPEVIEGMARVLKVQQTELGDSDARYEVVRMMQFITDTFESIDELLREIDRRNTSYSRASAERLQYLLNTDRDVKGKLVELLKGLPPLQSNHTSDLYEEMANLPLFDVKFADEEGLYREPQRKKREKPRPLKMKSDVQEGAFEAEASEMLQRIHSLFSQERIVDFILTQMGSEEILRAENMSIDEMDDFLRTMVALVKADEPDLPFTVGWDDEQKSVIVGGYRIPALTFAKRERGR